MSCRWHWASSAVLRSSSFCPRFSLSKNNDPNFVQIENSFDTFAPKFATVKEKKAYDTTREQARRLWWLIHSIVKHHIKTNIRTIMPNRITSLLYLLVLATTISSVQSRLSLACFKCPTSDDYSPECIDAISPPWPICLLHSADYFVDSAIDSATRCCLEDGDLSECKCPKKDTAKFLNKIGDYCKGVEICTMEKMVNMKNENPSASVE